MALCCGSLALCELCKFHPTHSSKALMESYERIMQHNARHFADKHCNDVFFVNRSSVTWANSNKQNKYGKTRVDQFYKSHKALVSHPTIIHCLKQRYAHFCSERRCIVWCGAGALLDLWDCSTEYRPFPLPNEAKLGCHSMIGNEKHFLQWDAGVLLISTCSFHRRVRFITRRHSISLKNRWFW